MFSQKENRHEYGTTIKNVLIKLYWQMDTQDFIFAERSALSLWAVTPSTREGVAACSPELSADLNLQA
jgi:hypothetical protein